MTDDSFSSRLKLIIGDIPFTKWATDNGFKTSTVNDWLNHGRIPRNDGMDALVSATGIPKEWWLYGLGDYPNQDTPKHVKHYDKSDKATALKLKSPENVFNPSDFDPLLMHHVIVAVEKMLKKHGKTIDPEKKADLFFLIHDCCKAAGGMDDSIVERFVSVAG